MDVRLVIATTTDAAAVDRGKDASKLPNTFWVREDLVEQVTEFDGDDFVIEFRKAQQPAARDARKRA